MPRNTIPVEFCASEEELFHRGSSPNPYTNGVIEQYNAACNLQETRAVRLEDLRALFDGDPHNLARDRILTLLQHLPRLEKFAKQRIVSRDAEPMEAYLKLEKLISSAVAKCLQNGQQNLAGQAVLKPDFAKALEMADDESKNGRDSSRIEKCYLLVLKDAVREQRYEDALVCIKKLKAVDPDIVLEIAEASKNDALIGQYLDIYLVGQLCKTNQHQKALSIICSHRPATERGGYLEKLIEFGKFDAEFIPRIVNAIAALPCLDQATCYWRLGKRSKKVEYYEKAQALLRSAAAVGAESSTVGCELVSDAIFAGKIIKALYLNYVVVPKLGLKKPYELQDLKSMCYERKAERALADNNFSAAAKFFRKVGYPVASVVEKMLEAGKAPLDVVSLLVRFGYSNDEAQRTLVAKLQKLKRYIQCMDLLNQMNISDREIAWIKIDALIQLAYEANNVALVEKAYEAFESFFWHGRGFGLLTTSIVLGFAKLGKLERAMECIHEIEDVEEKAQCLVALAAVKKDDAAILKEAKEATDGIDSKFLEKRRLKGALLNELAILFDNDDLRREALAVANIDRGDFYGNDQFVGKDNLLKLKVYFKSLGTSE